MAAWQWRRRLHGRKAALTALLALAVLLAVRSFSARVRSPPPRSRSAGHRPPPAAPPARGLPAVYTGPGAPARCWINATCDLLLALSAFRDPRRAPSLTVLTVGPTRLYRRSLYCHLRANGTLLRTVEVDEKEPMVRTWAYVFRLNFHGHFVYCPLRSVPRPEAVSHVSVSFAASDPGGGGLPVVRIPGGPPARRTLGACVCPLHGAAYDEAHVAAWIEINRHFGVSHFTFYNFSAHPGLRRVLGHYSARGVVSLLPWRLAPLPVDAEGAWPLAPDAVHYFGQVEANNDCLYRRAGRSRHLLFADLDELVVPLAARRLDGLLAAEERPRGAPAAFRFRMAVLRSEYPPEPTTAAEPLVAGRRVVFFARSYRERAMHTATAGAKLIVDPFRARAMEVHEISRGWDDSAPPRVRTVHPRRGLLAHYLTPATLYRRTVPGHRDRRLVRRLRPAMGRVRAVLDRLQRRSGGPGAASAVGA